MTHSVAGIDHASPVTVNFSRAKGIETDKLTTVLVQTRLHLNQGLPRQNEYLATENRIRRANCPRSWARLDTAGVWSRSNFSATSLRKQGRIVSDVKATSCFSQMPATKPNRAATRLSVANDSEACSSSMAVPHEFFDLTGRRSHTPHVPENVALPLDLFRSQQFLVEKSCTTNTVIRHQVRNQNDGLPVLRRKLIALLFDEFA